MQRNFDTDTGRVNLAFDMAQLWSLYLQNLAGYTRNLQSGNMSKAQYAEQNLCVTGVYARSLASRQLLEKGDTQTVNSWVNGLQSNINGITSADVSSAQLQKGFITGFNSGDLGSCASGGSA
jgi:predicted metalloprotease